MFVEKPLRRLRIARAVPLVLGVAMLVIAGFSLAISTGTFTPRLRYFGAPFDHEWSHLFAAARKEGIDTEDVYRMGSGRREKALFIGESHLAKYAARLDKVIHEHPGAPEAIMALGGGCIPIANFQDIRSRAKSLLASERQSVPPSV